MAEVIRNSVLNPLATCFVPSKFRTFYGGVTRVAIKTATKELNTDVISDDNRMSNRPLSTMNLERTMAKCLYNKNVIEQLDVKELNTSDNIETTLNSSLIITEERMLKNYLCNKTVIEKLDIDMLNTGGTSGDIDIVLSRPTSTPGETKRYLCNKTKRGKTLDIKVLNASGTFCPLKTILNRPSSSADLKRIIGKFLSNESVLKLNYKVKDSIIWLFQIPSFIPRNLPGVMKKSMFFEYETFGISKSMILSFLMDLIFLCAVDLINFKTYQSLSESVERKTVDLSLCGEEECLCPPMFGWVIPPTFFGNPLNLNYNCSKDYVHSPRRNGKGKTCTQTLQSLKLEEKSTSANVARRKELFEKCSLESQMTTTYVCDDVRIECSSKLEKEIQGNIQSSEKSLNGTNEPKSSVWNKIPSSEGLTGEQIIDDGSHPLLQSLNSETFKEDEDFESIKIAEDILGKCLSTGEECRPLAIEDPQTVCNPPCSVWCEFLPSAAKDTFMRFLKSQKHSETRVGTEEKPRISSYKVSFSTSEKSKKSSKVPLYRRSVSNDSFSFETLKKAFAYTNATSDTKSIEKLFLRKNPVAYFRSNDALEGEKMLYRASHSDLLNSHFKESSGKENGTTWGPFDGADSLWKPLPDCVPSNESIQKFPHKRGRELRRLRSAN